MFSHWVPKNQAQLLLQILQLRANKSRMAAELLWRWDVEDGSGWDNFDPGDHDFSNIFPDLTIKIIKTSHFSHYFLILFGRKLRFSQHFTIILPSSQLFTMDFHRYHQQRGQVRPEWAQLQRLVETTQAAFAEASNDENSGFSDVLKMF